MVIFSSKNWINQLIIRWNELENMILDLEPVYQKVFSTKGAILFSIILDNSMYGMSDDVCRMTSRFFISVSFYDYEKYKFL